MKPLQPARGDETWLPDWLYRLLPLIYATGGLACLAMLGVTRLSLVSSVLLLAAAGLITVWRVTRRPTGSRRRGHPSARRASMKPATRR